MKIIKINRGENGYPEQLLTISSPPKQLYCIGAPLDDLLSAPAVAVVGSRKVSAYGKQVTHQLTGELASKGIVIVSGLAMGTDAIAHEATIEVGGKAIVVLGAGLDNISPVSNINLAKRIIAGGGAIVTEYPEGTVPFKINFVARNRIVSGLSNAVLITEAAGKSGSLHTANFALEQGREVCVVPGNINNPYSVGSNNLIKAGAHLITTVDDVLKVIGLKSSRKAAVDLIAENENEYVLLTLINNGLSDGQQLLVNSQIDPAVFNQTLSMLEISGKIIAIGSDQWQIK